MKLVPVILLLIGIGGSAWANPVARAVSQASADKLLLEGKISLAIQEYESALKIHPTPALYFNLAIAYYQTKRLSDAIAALEALLKMAGEDVEARYNLGCLWLYKGDFEKAAFEFQKALSCCAEAPEFAPLIRQGLKLSGQIKKADRSTQDLLTFVTQYGLPAL